MPGGMMHPVGVPRIRTAEEQEKDRLELERQLADLSKKMGVTPEELIQQLAENMEFGENRETPGFPPAALPATAPNLPAPILPPPLRHRPKRIYIGDTDPAPFPLPGTTPQHQGSFRGRKLPLDIRRR